MKRINTLFALMAIVGLSACTPFTPEQQAIADANFHGSKNKNKNWCQVGGDCYKPAAAPIATSRPTLMR